MSEKLHRGINLDNALAIANRLGCVVWKKDGHVHLRCDDHPSSTKQVLQNCRRKDATASVVSWLRALEGAFQAATGAAALSVPALGPGQLIVVRAGPLGSFVGDPLKERQEKERDARRAERRERKEREHAEKLERDRARAEAQHAELVRVAREHNAGSARTLNLELLESDDLEALAERVSNELERRMKP